MVGDDEILVEDELLAEAVAGRAGALRGVEGEQARLDLGDGEAGDGAGEFSEKTMRPGAPKSSFMPDLVRPALLGGRVGGVEVRRGLRRA